MKRRLAIILAVTLGIPALLILAMIAGGQGAQGSTPPPLTCSRAYGMCQVTEYIHIRANGTQWIETCFAEAPVVEGHGGVRVAVVDCYRP